MTLQDGRRLQMPSGPGPAAARRSAGQVKAHRKVAEVRAPRPEGALPEDYGETRIVLLPVDPYLVHVYWEVSAGAMRYVKALTDAGSLRPQAMLRFHDVTGLPEGGVRAEGSFDVEIDLASRNWYVHLLSPERAYVADLGFRGGDGRFHRVARSNRGETPRAWPCEEAGQQRMRVVEVDGTVHVEPVEDAGAVRDDGDVSEASGTPDRSDMRRKGLHAVSGRQDPPLVAAREADRIRGTMPARGPAEFPGERGTQGARPGREAGRAERTRAVGTQDRRPSPLPTPRPVDASEELMVKLQAIYGRRQRFFPPEKAAFGERPSGGERAPAGMDLSLFCEGLFVAGLPSSRIAAEGEKEDRDDG